MLSLISFELTVQEILADLPLDAGGFIVVVLMVAFAGFVWVGSRNGGGANAPAPARPIVPPVPTDPVAGRTRADSAEPDLQPVIFDPAVLSAAPDFRGIHPEVR